MSASPVSSVSSASAPVTKRAPFPTQYFALDFGDDTLDVVVNHDITAHAIVKNVWARLSEEAKKVALGVQGETKLSPELSTAPAGVGFRTSVGRLCILNPSTKASSLVERARNDANLFEGTFTLVACATSSFVVRKRHSAAASSSSSKKNSDKNPAPTKKPRTQNKKRARVVEDDDEE